MDDIQVIKVLITILDELGQPLEQGEAELELGVYWEYRPANQGRIQVEAWDMAGNAVQREFDNAWSFTRFQRKAKQTSEVCF